MLYGQMSLPKLSNKADYIQLDVCGLSAEEAVEKYQKYKADLPVILHGDWTKKGNSENNIERRRLDYISIIQELKKVTKVIGFTMHPTFRKKVTFEDFLSYCREIEIRTNTPVFIENRSNEKIWLSKPQEIVDFSQAHNMTVDFPQLFISCKYDYAVFIQTLKKIKWDNVKELHVANIKRQNGRTFVARKLDDGELSYHDILPVIQFVPYLTFEILGGVLTFENQVNLLTTIKH